MDAALFHLPHPFPPLTRGCTPPRLPSVWNEGLTDAGRLATAMPARCPAGSSDAVPFGLVALVGGLVPGGFLVGFWEGLGVCVLDAGGCMAVQVIDAILNPGPLGSRIWVSPCVGDPLSLHLPAFSSLSLGLWLGT